MKTTSSLLLLILFALLPVELLAQVPQSIPYQAVARDNQTLLTNQSIEVRFSILEGGTPSYQELHSVQTNEYGRFTAMGTYGSTLTIPSRTVDTQGRVKGVSEIPFFDNNTTYATGSGPALTGTTYNLENTSVNPGSFGTTTEIPVLTADAQGITNFVSSIGLQSSNMAFNSTILPDTDDTYDLGSATQRFNTVFSTVGVINTSDVREKKQIEELRYGMEEIMQLKPVSFTWKNQLSKDRKLGLLAQQVLPIIPNVVKTHETTRNKKTGKLERKELNRYGVYYSDLIPVLIRGMQEQQEKIEGQEDELKSQEERISQQEEILEAQQKIILDMQKRLERLEKEVDK